MSYRRLIVFVNDVRIGIYDMDKLNLLKRKCEQENIKKTSIFVI